VCLKFDNRSEKLIRSCQRKEGRKEESKKGGRKGIGKGGKVMGNEEKENLKEECNYRVS